MSDIELVRTAIESFYDRGATRIYKEGRMEDAMLALSRLEAREAKKTVPMAMLAHIATMGRSLAGSDKNEQDSKKLSIIASIYGYEVTE